MRLVINGCCKASEGADLEDQLREEQFGKSFCEDASALAKENRCTQPLALLIENKDVSQSFPVLKS